MSLVEAASISGDIKPTSLITALFIAVPIPIMAFSTPGSLFTLVESAIRVIESE